MAKKKLFKVICRTIEFILGFFIVMVLLLFFRLSIEPIHIQNLMPSLISMIKDSDSQTDVSMKDAYIELAFSKGRLMDVCLEDVLVSDKKDFILNVDKAHVSFNPFALLIGRIVVTDVAIDKAFVQVNVATIDSKKEEKSVSVERKINRIRRIFERLDSLSLTKMELNLLLGKDKKIIAPELTASLTRDNAMMNAQVSGRFYVDKTFLNMDLL